MSAPTPRFLPGTMPAPRNHWYMAAFTHEVAEKPLARTFLGEEVVLFRTAGGKVAALEDRCAHRAAALSPGKVIGDSIQCFYHGIRYGTDGRCTEIPSQSAVPAKMQVRRYPVVEASELIWIWMGDPDKADISKLPDLSEFGLGSSSYRHDTMFRMGINGNYQLLQENLLDVSHISFLHEGGFDTGTMCSTEPTITVENGWIRIDREVEEVVSGAYAMTFELPDGIRVRRILSSRSLAPSVNVISNYFWDLDRPGSEPYVIHAFSLPTPESVRSTHYFTAISKTYGVEKLPPFVKQMVWDIFLTDKTAIESIQRSYDQLGSDAPDVSVRVDAAALRYRGMVSNLLEAEAAAGAEK